jgi:hypothetical protein
LRTSFTKDSIETNINKLLDTINKIYIKINILFDYINYIDSLIKDNINDTDETTEYTEKKSGGDIAARLLDKIYKAIPKINDIADLLEKCNNELKYLRANKNEINEKIQELNKTNEMVNIFKEQVEKIRKEKTQKLNDDIDNFYIELRLLILRGIQDEEIKKYYAERKLIMSSPPPAPKHSEFYESQSVYMFNKNDKLIKYLFNDIDKNLPLLQYLINLLELLINYINTKINKISSININNNFQNVKNTFFTIKKYIINNTQANPLLNMSVVSERNGGSRLNPIKAITKPKTSPKPIPKPKAPAKPKPKTSPKPKPKTSPKPKPKAPAKPKPKAPSKPKRKTTTPKPKPKPSPKAPAKPKPKTPPKPKPQIAKKK